MESACSLSSTQRIVRLGRIFSPIPQSHLWARRAGLLRITKLFNFGLGKKVRAYKKVRAHKKDEGIIGRTCYAVKYPERQQQNFSLKCAFCGLDTQRARKPCILLHTVIKTSRPAPLPPHGHPRAR